MRGPFVQRAGQVLRSSWFPLISSCWLAVGNSTVGSSYAVGNCDSDVLYDCKYNRLRPLDPFVGDLLVEVLDVAPRAEGMGVVVSTTLVVLALRRLLLPLIGRGCDPLRCP